jgi:hypothetical protein
MKNAVFWDVSRVALLIYISEERIASIIRLEIITEV